MQRFYLDTGLGEGILEVEDKEFFHQISHVLRSKLGDEITIFNGDGYDFIYLIKSISKKSITLEYKEKAYNNNDPSLLISLYQAMPNKYEKIEYIIQKGLEVGISDFVFFPSERSQKLQISPNKIARFESIMKEALEQCGGNRKPSIIFLGRIPSDITGETYVCHTFGKSERGGFRSENLQSINLFVGPEGGFSDKEIEIFEKSGYRFLNFGGRILRTETMSSVVSFLLLNS